MPPLPSATKGRGKKVDARRSRSRNTTPSSVISASTAPSGGSVPVVEIETAKVPAISQPQYSDILERLESRPSTLEPRHLHDIIDELRTLSEAAEKKAESCENAIRVIHDQLKDLESEHRERDRQVEQVRRSKSRKEDVITQKPGKAKKRKDRQDGSDNVEIKREGTSQCFIWCKCVLQH